MTGVWIWIKQHWIAATAVGVVFLLSGWLVTSCHPTPKIDVIQLAAQQAASAIVTVEHADSTLAQHRADSLRLQGMVKALSLASTKNAALINTLHQMEAQATVIPPAAPLAVWADRVSLLTQTLDTANVVIASLQGMVLADSVVRVGLVVDNQRLARSLQATRDTLATHREVVIPAAALKTGLDFNPLHLLHLTVGYGVQYAGGKFTTGPQATVGLSIRL